MHVWFEGFWVGIVLIWGFWVGFFGWGGGFVFVGVVDDFLVGVF